MAEVAGVSGQNSQQQLNNDEAAWDAQLNDASKEGGNNNWRVQESSPTEANNNIVDENGNFTPEVTKILNNFIGNMTVEMVKSQSPAQKIDMGEDE